VEIYLHEFLTLLEEVGGLANFMLWLLYFEEISLV
jgi:hypothetical protein